MTASDPAGTDDRVSRITRAERPQPIAVVRMQPQELLHPQLAELEVLD